MSRPGDFTAITEPQCNCHMQTSSIPNCPVHNYRMTNHPEGREPCPECGGKAVTYLTMPVVDGPDVALCRPCFRVVLAASYAADEREKLIGDEE